MMLPRSAGDIKPTFCLPSTFQKYFKAIVIIIINICTYVCFRESVVDVAANEIHRVSIWLICVARGALPVPPDTHAVPSD